MKFSFDCCEVLCEALIGYFNFMLINEVEIKYSKGWVESMDVYINGKYDSHECRHYEDIPKFIMGLIKAHDDKWGNLAKIMSPRVAAYATAIYAIRSV